MRRLILFLAVTFALSAQQQQTSHTYNVVPTPGGTSGGARAGELRFWNATNTSYAASPGQCPVSSVGGGFWTPGHCETIINRGAVALYDMTTQSDPTHYADLSGYGNHATIHGGVTSKSYGVDGDGVTGTYLEVTNANLKPSPLTSGPELSTNGSFAGGSLTGWACAVSACTGSSSTTLTSNTTATYTVGSAKLQAVTPARLYQVIPVQPNTVYNMEFWTVGSGSGTGMNYAVLLKRPDSIGTVNVSGTTVTWQTGNDDFSNSNRFGYAAVGDAIVVNGTACTVATLVNSITVTINACGAAGTGVAYTLAGSTTPIIASSATGNGTTAWSAPSFKFITPANPTACFACAGASPMYVQVEFYSSTDGTASYLTGFTFRQDTPFTVGAAFRRNGIISGARQYLITQLFDLEDNGAANIQPSRIWAIDFDNGSGQLEFHNNFQQGTSSGDAIIATGVNPANGDWHYVAVSVAAAASTTYPFYRQAATVWIDGAVAGQYTYPIPSTPLWHDTGLAPLRIFATDATGNQHNLLGSIAFAHVNRAAWSNQDAADAAGCMRALLVARGQTPWSGSSNCPRGGANLSEGIGITIKDGKINIGQPVARSSSPEFGGATWDGATTSLFAPSAPVITPIHVFGRLGGAIQGYIAFDGNDNTLLFGPTTNSGMALVANGVRTFTWGGTAINSNVLHFFNALTTSLWAPATAALTPIHVFGRTGGAVQGHIAYDGSDHAIVFGPTTNSPGGLVANGTRVMTWTSAGVTLPLSSGAVNRPVCFDAAGKLFAGTNTAGVLSCP